MFCKTCYNNEKGKSTNLSHTTNDNTCRTRVQLNAMIDKILPLEVQEQELNTHEEQETEESEVILKKVNFWQFF